MPRARCGWPFLLFWLPPEPSSCARARERIGAFARREGIGADDTRQFLALVSEAVANAVRHSGTSLPIDVHCRIEPDLIVAEIRDRGVGFKKPGGSHPFGLPHTGAEGGRGLPIMQGCSDVFAVETAPGAGTRVTVGRRTAGVSTRALREAAAL